MAQGQLLRKQTRKDYKGTTPPRASERARGVRLCALWVYFPFFLPRHGALELAEGCSRGRSMEQWRYRALRATAAPTTIIGRRELASFGARTRAVDGATCFPLLSRGVGDHRQRPLGALDDVHEVL